MKLIPTILSHSKEEFYKKYDELVYFCEEIQIDFMDGKFVNQISVQLKDIPLLDKSLTFEAHLMTLNPEEYINELAQKGFKRVFFHFEACENHLEVAKKIKEKGMSPGLAINPQTSLEKIRDLLEGFDRILIMGVNPGKENQDFIVSTKEKIGYLKNKIFVQVDGGINPETLKYVKNADAINIGSFITGANNPLKAFEEMEKLL